MVTTHTHLFACSSTLLCLGLTRWMESIQIRLNLTRNISDCVPSLLWHIKSLISAFGAFFILLGTSWFCHSLGLETWTFGTGLGFNRGLVKERKIQLYMNNFRLCLFCLTFGPALFKTFLLSPQQRTKQLNAKISHVCCGFTQWKLDSSTSIHLGSFIGLYISYYWTYISSVCHYLLWICQCQILY